MKYSLFIIVLACYFSNIAFSQNRTLNGKILYLNSGKTPAEGVEVAGIVKNTNVRTNFVFSNAKGEFTLVFTKSEVGHFVEITVGDKDGKGQMIEVVNAKEVEQYFLPANANNDFKIIICKKGERDIAAQRYYKILKISVDKELAKKKKEIDGALAENKKR